MTDLEKIKLCAEALGLSNRLFPTQISGNEYVQYQLPAWKKIRWECYDPFHDDAQAMALVKKFNLHIQRDIGKWRVWYTGKHAHMALKDDLNRAIVECVAKMQGMGEIHD